MLSSTDPNAPSDDRSNLARFLEVFSKEHRIDPSDIRQGAVGSSVSMSFEDWLLAPSPPWQRIRWVLLPS